MYTKLKTYWPTVLVFIVSIICLAFVKYQFSELIQDFTAIPVVASLFAALFQILRDQAAHDKALLLQQSQNSFSLASGSHMAIAAFNKHVEFSDKYIKEYQNALQMLFETGASIKLDLSPQATILHKLRQEYAIWLTQEIDVALEPFEVALRQITANAIHLKVIQNQENPQLSYLEVSDNLYKLFAEFMGLEEWQDEKLTDELTKTALINRFRTILGIEDLTKMRALIIEKHMSSLKK
jgi:hypothetical protein